MFLPWAWRENDRLRRVASAILVDASLTSTVGRFVQESFAPVYPDSGGEWIDERVSLSPVGFNRSILDAEASAERFSQAGRAGVVLRFGGFYGHDAFQTTEMIKYVRRGWALLPGSPGAYISSLAHDDAATAVAAALTLPAGIYNAVDDEPVTHRAFIDSLAEALGVRAPKLLPTWITPLFGSLGALASRSLRISNQRLRSASSWTPKYSNVRQGWGAVVAQLGTEPRLFQGLARPAKRRGE
jgi:nucleoside-diphosphate-sugar epimerase